MSIPIELRQAQPDLAAKEEEEEEKKKQDWLALRVRDFKTITMLDEKKEFAAATAISFDLRPRFDKYNGDSATEYYDLLRVIRGTFEDFTFVLAAAADYFIRETPLVLKDDKKRPKDHACFSKLYSLHRFQAACTRCTNE